MYKKENWSIRYFDDCGEEQVLFFATKRNCAYFAKNTGVNVITIKREVRKNV